jgi:hypothetical protein
LSENPVGRGPPHNPGAGGWPTIRYYNKETGPDGGTYKKRTEKSMCDELGNKDYMFDYVEEYGKTSLCDVTTKAGCNEKSSAYIDKISALSNEEMMNTLDRLENMDGAKMKPELHLWMTARKKIISQLMSASVINASGDEL